MILTVRLDNIEETQLKTIAQYYNEIHQTKLNRSDIIRVMISQYYEFYKKMGSWNTENSG